MQWTNAAIAWPLTLVKPAETLALDWLNTNEQQKKGDLINHLAEHHFPKKKMIKTKNTKKKMIKNNKKYKKNN